MGFFEPELDNPYPESGWERITDFEYLTPLGLWRDVKALPRGHGEDADYLTRGDYCVRYKLDGQVREITVPSGMLTDLTSVPRAARWLVGRVGPHLEAAIVHDFLYIAWQDVKGGHQPQEADRRFADELMRVAMKAAGVGRLKRFLIHKAVRTFGSLAYWGRNENRYWREEEQQALAAEPSRAA